MTVEVCENPNIVYYWISQAEKGDVKLQSSLTAQHKHWTDKGYRVCTFVSGRENLVDLTKELLIHNQEIFSSAELQHEDNIMCS